ncbi:hypothetical protein [Streptomyces sp. NPDC016675]|uniref:hypothetical protein n=1 Tax=Streptomyces sp. NPDC016675 TaxID=3364970 RepID=UPI0036FD375D
MSTPAAPSSPQATRAPRDPDDACPGTPRPHAADDGAPARVRVPGGAPTVRRARALAEETATRPSGHHLATALAAITS